MKKIGSILLLMVTLSLFVNINNIQGFQPTNLSEKVPIYIKGTYKDVEHGAEAFCEFNRSIMTDNQVYSPNEEVWFGFNFDVFDARLSMTEYAPTQVDIWYFDEPDMYGVYQENRFQGVLNVFLDDVDFGLSNFLVSAQVINTTQDLNPLYLSPGWHLLTVFVAEYISDPGRSHMYWDYDKDELWFYIQEYEETPSEMETSDKMCTVIANPKRNDELGSYSFDWNFLNIWPRAYKSEGSPQTATLTDETDAAQFEVDYNITTDVFTLTNYTDAGGAQRAGYVDETTMGTGIQFWWSNDNPVTTNPSATLPLNKDKNYIYFAAVSFMIIILTFRNSTPNEPRADIATEIFVVEENIEPSSFGVVGIIVGLSLFSVMSLILKKRRKE